jgi:hypothetical protein
MKIKTQIVKLFKGLTAFHLVWFAFGWSLSTVIWGNIKPYEGLLMFVVLGFIVSILMLMIKRK